MHRRYFSFALGGLIVLSICAVVTLNFWGVLRLNAVQEEQAAHIAAADAGVHLTQQMHVHFKVQVQEWKNVLLRGTREADFARYFEQFEQEEAQVRAILQHLRQLPPSSGVPLAELEIVEASMKALGEQYRAALEQFDPADPTSYLAVDRAVRGIDREPARRMHALVESVIGKAERLEDAARLRRARVARNVILGSALTAAVAMAGCALFMADRWRRERALVRARQAAEHANEAKDAFLTNMSHELRTPLNGVLGMASVLNYTGLSEEQRECVETINHSGMMLLELINGILDLARIAEGKLTLREEAFPLLDRLDECCEVVASKAAMKHLDFCLDIAPEVPASAVADAGRMRQILLNLLGNAIKFTSAGSVVLRVRRVESGERSWLEFAVADTGVGIRASDQAKLFKAFSQIDSTSTRRFGGSGLGLVISRDLAELMGGKLELESTFGEGSTFTLRLPLREDPEGPREPIAADLPTAPGLCAAILDASSANAPVLEAQLRRLGMAVSVFPSLAQWHQRPAEVSWDFIVVGEVAGLSSPLLPVAEWRAALRETTGRLVRWTPRGAVENRVVREAFDAVLYKPLKLRQLGALLAAVASTRTPGESAAPAPGRLLDPDDAAKQAKPPAEAGMQTEILVVDDNRVNLAVTNRLLRACGFDRIALVDSGEAALEACRKQLYNLVFMDMQMPGKDGLETTRILRARGSAEPRPWIVALTANALPEHRRRCLEAGMDDFLAKPIQRDALAQAVARFARQQHPPTGSGTTVDRACAVEA